MPNFNFVILKEYNKTLIFIANIVKLNTNLNNLDRTRIR